jgi:hypothetical protein
LSDLDFVVRACLPQEAPAILELWKQDRSEHASTADRLEDVQRLLSEMPGACSSRSLMPMLLMMRFWAR